MFGWLWLRLFQQQKKKQVKVAHPHLKLQSQLIMLLLPFETVYDFLQGDIEIDYNESKVLKSLKRRLGLLRIKNQTQTRIDSFFK